ncbi:hypothetical protein SGRIM128S_01093 [Streptomyces griseomycini]
MRRPVAGRAGRRSADGGEEDRAETRRCRGQPPTALTVESTPPAAPALRAGTPASPPGRAGPGLPPQPGRRIACAGGPERAGAAGGSRAHAGEESRSTRERSRERHERPGHSHRSPPRARSASSARPGSTTPAATPPAASASPSAPSPPRPPPASSCASPTRASGSPTSAASSTVLHGRDVRDLQRARLPPHLVGLRPPAPTPTARRSLRGLLTIGFVGSLLAYFFRSLTEAPGEKLHRAEYGKAREEYEKRVTRRSGNPSKKRRRS